MKFSVESKDFKKSVDYLVKNGVGEGSLSFDEKGVHFKGIEPSQIVMVELDFPVSAFSVFNTNEGETLSVDFGDLSNALSCFPANVLCEKMDNKLRLLSDDVELFLPLLASLEESEVPSVNCDWTSVYSVEPVSVRSALKNVLRFSPKAEFNIVGEVLSLSSYGGHIASVSIKVKSEVIKVNDGDGSIVSASYLESVLASIDSLKLSMGSAMPLKFEGVVGLAKARVFLACVLPSDDDDEPEIKPEEKKKSESKDKPVSKEASKTVEEPPSLEELEGELK